MAIWPSIEHENRMIHDDHSIISSLIRDHYMLSGGWLNTSNVLKNASQYEPAKGARGWRLLYMTYTQTVTLPPLRGTDAQTPSGYPKGGHPEIPPPCFGYPPVPHNTPLQWIR